MAERAGARHDLHTDVVRCPHCHGELTFVASWSVRGLWGYDEVRTYECQSHGPIFVRPQTEAVEHSSSKQASDKTPGNRDRDSLVSAPRKPTPTLDTDAIAIPEPDSD
jgi:hypothetical protein